MEADGGVSPFLCFVFTQDVFIVPYVISGGVFHLFYVLFLHVFIAPYVISVGVFHLSHKNFVVKARDSNL